MTPSIYHFYCLLGNTTTIEGWEKDRATTMVRHGKLREVSSLPVTFLQFSFTDLSGQVSLRKWRFRFVALVLHSGLLAPRKEKKHRICFGQKITSLVLADSDTGHRIKI